MKRLATSLLLLAACTSQKPQSAANAPVTILNASFDASRELFREVNDAFVRDYEAKTGRKVEVRMSHAGSGKQARAVIDGLEADVVTLALAHDVDEIVRRGGAVKDGWRQRSPHGGSPFTSTVVFVVRKGNPKGIRDWDDLVKPGVEVIATNPKTGGGARWSYLAAWGAARARLGDDAKARAWVEELYKHVPVLDSGARGSSNTFAQRGIGDVLVSWESEAVMLARELPDAGFETVVPATSILAEPVAAVVDRVVDKRGTRAVAEAYLAFLSTEAAQQAVARNGFRPRLAGVPSPLPALELFTIDRAFGGWDAAQKDHFGDGATFDQVTAR